MKIIGKTASGFLIEATNQDVIEPTINSLIEDFFLSDIKK